MRSTTEAELLAARWRVVNAELAALSAGRDRTPEGDELSPRERELLAELDAIEGRLGELQRDDLAGG